MAITIPGSKVQTTIELSLAEIELEVNQLVDGLVVDYQKNLNNGMSRKEALAAVTAEITGGIGRYNTFRNTLNRLVREQVKVAVAIPAIVSSENNPQQQFDWVLGDVKTSHCPDCLRLSRMEPRTIDEWRQLGYGLPREGQTACNVGCRCMLRPIGE